MQAVSDRFREALTESHTPIATVTVDGTEIPIASGSISKDAQSATRSGISVELAIDESELATYTADEIEALLVPAGNEMVVQAGIAYPDGTSELIPQGVFRIDSQEVSESGDGGLTVQVTGLDRSAVVIEAVFESPGTTASGAVVEDEIERLIGEVAAADGWTLDLDTTGVTLPLIAYEAGDDRWDYCQALAEAAACILYFDPSGTLRMERLIQSNSADLTVSEGESGTLTSINKRMSRENAVSRVYVTGESSGDDPVFGVAVDDDPTSPTYYYGPFGQVTYAWSSSFIVDEDNANDAAQKILAQKVGLGQEISFESILNPAVEPYDVVLLNRERVGVSNELHVIDSIQLPLGASGPTMNCSTRVARVF